MKGSSKQKTNSKQAHQELPTSDIKPINFQALNTLGEPDPSNITKQDILSSIAYDKQGQLLAVGDRGGRVIVFQRIEEDGEMDFDYLTEF
jgi:serine/threonine-protein phosphatase 2A regulatory subunit B